MKTETPRDDKQSLASPAALATAAVAALLASTCCIAPLALVLIGISGAWIGQLAALAPYQPIFVGVAAVSLLVAGRRIWREPACDDGRVCATPAGRRTHKAMFVVLAALLAVVVGFPFAAPWFY